MTLTLAKGFRWRRFDFTIECDRATDQGRKARMHMRGLVLCAATVALSITSASATMRIADAVVRSVEISRFHPDPIAAIEQADREAAEV